MKTQCPYCKAEQHVPDAYEGRQVKCPSCSGVFAPAPFIESPLPRKRPQEVLKHIWLATPWALRTAFLASLGVICALLFTIWVLTALHAPQVPPTDDAALLPAYSNPLATSGAVGDAAQLYKYLGWLEMGAVLKTISLSEGTRSIIIGQLEANVTILTAWPMVADSEDARQALIAAIEAEIAVLNYEQQHPNPAGSLLEDPDFVTLMERSMTLRAEAERQIDKFISKM